jgi:putative flippase GtrA
MAKYSFILRFLFVGGSTGFIFLGLTFGLVEGLGISAVLASTFALLIAVSYNYLLHYHWTFESEADHRLALTRFLLMGAGSILLNGLIMYFGTLQDAFHYMVVQFCAGLAMVFWSLCLSYFWVFKSNH